MSVNKVNSDGSLTMIAGRSTATDTLKEDFSTVETTSTSTRAYNQGDSFIMETGQLVKATTAIAIGDTIAIGTNVAATSVAELLANKVDKEQGKVLSTNDYDDTEKSKVASITDKASKVQGGTSGNLAGLDSNGDLTDANWSADKTTTNATGNPISISGLKSNQLAINPIITFEPIQAGSGTPSPSNVRAISGYDKVEVESCGKNIVQGIITGYNIASNGVISADTDYSLCYARVKANQKYTISDGASQSVYAFYFEKPKANATSYNDSRSVTTDHTFTSPIDGYVAFRITINYGTAQLEEGQTATTYVPYHKTTSISESLGQTVYGASHDVRTGKLTNQLGLYTMETKAAFNQSGTHKYVLYYPTGIKSVSGATDDCVFERLPFVSGMGDYFGYYHASNMIVVCVPDNYTIEEFNTNIAESKFTYPLATPTEIQLTPHEISLLKDYAYVSTNGTSMSFSYHNGEMASLADVSQLGETVNELGDKVSEINSDVEQLKNQRVNIDPVNKKFTSSTTLAYTGYSITIPKRRSFALHFELIYENARPLQLVVSASDSSTAEFVTYYNSEVATHGSICGRTGDGDLTLYAWAKYNGASTNTLHISGWYEP